MVPTNPEVTIRRAIPEDSAAIASILRGLGWFAHINSEPSAETEARIARHMALCSADLSHTVLVTENSAHKVVGYVSVHWLPYLMLLGPEGFISELFVLESERGRGIGRMLLDSVKKLAKQRGCVRLHLVNGSNRESYQRRFYEKLGWKERPEIADFILSVTTRVTGSNNRRKTKGAR
ncbi:MAG: GNAT family N-acetyltransferase [Candidatus Lindowbacteria bacterium]|nr:GNAT family N-acetyltransferase [Candidatus Lindowbacteria bacterium]